MKPMTIDEFHATVGDSSREKYGPICTELVKKFTASGYEAVEITPDDLHVENMTQSKISYVRKKLADIVDALKLDQIVGVRSNKEHVYMFRKDM